MTANGAHSAKSPTVVRREGMQVLFGLIGGVLILATGGAAFPDGGDDASVIARVLFAIGLLAVAACCALAVVNRWPNTVTRKDLTFAAIPLAIMAALLVANIRAGRDENALLWAPAALVALFAGNLILWLIQWSQQRRR